MIQKGYLILESEINPLLELTFFQVSAKFIPDSGDDSHNQSVTLSRRIERRGRSSAEQIKLKDPIFAFSGMSCDNYLSGMPPITSGA